MNWISPTKTERLCLHYLRRRNGRSTAARRRCHVWPLPLPLQGPQHGAALASMLARSFNRYLLYTSIVLGVRGMIMNKLGQKIPCFHGADTQGNGILFFKNPWCRCPLGSKSGAGSRRYQDYKSISSSHASLEGMLPCAIPRGSFVAMTQFGAGVASSGSLAPTHPQLSVTR